MKNSPVSIVIPCYQQEAFLRAAVDSALGQTHENVQVIVVNDGSTDDSHQIAMGYGDRITYICQPNAGVTVARNRGADAADGRYLIFLDGDDVLDPHAVQFHLAGMDDSESRLTVLANREFVGEPPFVQPDTLSPAFETKSAFPKLFHTNYGPPFAFMFSRRYFRDVGGFALKSWGCEDWDLWTRLALREVDVAMSEVVGGYYRRSEESRSFDRGAMLNSRCEHIAQLHAQIVANDELLELWGGELLLAEQGVLRRLLVQKTCDDKIATLAQLIGELYASNVKYKQGRFKRLLNNAIGYRSEILALWQYRLTEPVQFERYRKGVT